MNQVSGLPGHITSKCEIYDVSGKFIRNNVGRFCLYEQNGNTIINRPGLLTKYDKNFHIIWQKPVRLMHHQFTRSVVDSSLLALESKFDYKGPVYPRHDLILVRDENGEIIKSVNFSEILGQLKQKGHSIVAPVAAGWVSYLFRKGEGASEQSHVNSFAEMYDEVGGKKIRTGYLLHCNHQKKIIFLDDTLQRVTDVIDTRGRSLHDVRLLHPKKLIFYQNFEETPNTPLYSSVESLDLVTRKYTQIYSGQSPMLSGRACGAVQLLDENRLFITHSNCNLSPHSVKLTTLEYVDLKTGARAVLTFDETRFINEARLDDLDQYLKNNQGL